MHYTNRKFKLKIMHELLFKCAVVALGVLVSETVAAQDVTLSMYMYLANHLTPQECLTLAAYLYADGLDPTVVKELGNYFDLMVHIITQNNPFIVSPTI